jgi:hypothetical protein
VTIRQYKVSSDQSLIKRRQALSMAAAIPALKVGLGAAIITGVGSKSYWHLARTPATEMGCPTHGSKHKG